MQTVCFSVRFPDGHEACAEISSSSNSIRYPVHFAGEVERLPLRPEWATVAELEQVFQKSMRLNNAVLSVSRKCGLEMDEQDQATSDCSDHPSSLQLMS